MTDRGGGGREVALDVADREIDHFMFQSGPIQFGLLVGRKREIFLEEIIPQWCPAFQILFTSGSGQRSGTTKGVLARVHIVCPNRHHLSGFFFFFF